MSQRTFSREACHSGLTSERSLPYNRRVSWYDGALATRQSLPFIVSALSVTSTRLPDERRDSFFVFAFLRFTCLRPINVCPTTAGITKHVSDTRRRRSDVRRCRHSRVLAGGFVGCHHRLRDLAVHILISARGGCWKHDGLGVVGFAQGAQHVEVLVKQHHIGSHRRCSCRQPASS